MLNRKGANMLAREFTPGFRLALHHKDLGIVTSAAREAGVVIPLGAVVAQLMAALVARGDGGLDHSGLLQARRRAVRPCRPTEPRRRADMARMTAADAAVAIMQKEGVTHAFGVPGAAINPLYAALRRSAAASTTCSPGTSRAPRTWPRATPGRRAGNIGVCIGTSGPAGTDMITGLYSASADSIPILCITGQAPVARLHKEDFQAVDIASIAAPLTKMAVTVLEAAQVPGRVPQGLPPHALRAAPARC